MSNTENPAALRRQLRELQKKFANVEAYYKKELLRTQQERDKWLNNCKRILAKQKQ